MVSEHFQSPNAIPPRRSSTGLGGTYINPAQPVLTPVPEATWISQNNKIPPIASPVATPPGPATPSSADHVVKQYNDSSWSLEKERIVCGPFDYMSDQPGKDIRKQFIAAFNTWLKVPSESLDIITKVVGMLHTASLLYVQP